MGDAGDAVLASSPPMSAAPKLEAGGGRDGGVALGSVDAVCDGGTCRRGSFSVLGRNGGEMDSGKDMAAAAAAGWG